MKWLFLLIVLLPGVFSISFYSGTAFAGNQEYTNSSIEVINIDGEMIQSLNTSDGDFRIGIKDLTENEKFFWQINNKKIDLPKFEIFHDNKSFINYNLYAQASCEDGIKNQKESDIDCGGTCGLCDSGKSCKNNFDCTSSCINKICTTQELPELMIFDIIRENELLLIKIEFTNEDSYNLEKKINIKQNDITKEINIINYKTELNTNQLEEFDLDKEVNITLKASNNELNYEFEKSQSFLFLKKYQKIEQNVDYQSNLIIEFRNKEENYFDLELKDNRNSLMTNISSYNTITTSNKTQKFTLIGQDFSVIDEFQINNQETDKYILEFNYDQNSNIIYGIQSNKKVTICPITENVFLCKNNCETLIELKTCIETRDQVVVKGTQDKNTLKQPIDELFDQNNQDFEINSNSYRNLFLATLFFILFYISIEIFFDKNEKTLSRRNTLFNKDFKKNLQNSLQQKELLFKNNSYINTEKNGNIERIQIEKETEGINGIFTKLQNKFENFLSSISLIDNSNKKKVKEKIENIKLDERDNKSKGIKIETLSDYYDEIKLFFDKYQHMKEQILTSHIKKHKLNREFLIKLYNLCNNSRFNGKLAKKEIPKIEFNKLKIIPTIKIDDTFKIMILYYYINKMNHTYTRTQILEFVYYNFSDIELIYNIVDNLKHN